MVAMVFAGGRYDKELSDEINRGRNEPVDPLQAFSLHLDDLEEQAKQFLDGTGVQTDEQAEDVSRLLNMVRKASNDAEDARKVEKKPHDDAAKAVQARWKPILEKADLIADTAKQALAPFLRKKEEATRAAAQAAIEEARQKAEAAAQAAQQARPDDLAGQTNARLLQQNAADAAKRADKLSKAKVQAKGGERAVGLRSVWTPTLISSVDALRFYRETQPDELRAWLLEQATKDVRAGKRLIPGFEISEEKVPV